MNLCWVALFDAWLLAHCSVSRWWFTLLQIDVTQPRWSRLRTSLFSWELYWICFWIHVPTEEVFVSIVRGDDSTEESAFHHSLTEESKFFFFPTLYSKIGS